MQQFYISILMSTSPETKQTYFSVVHTLWIMHIATPTCWCLVVCFCTLVRILLSVLGLAMNDPAILLQGLPKVSQKTNRCTKFVLFVRFALMFWWWLFNAYFCFEDFYLGVVWKLTFELRSISFVHFGLLLFLLSLLLLFFIFFNYYYYYK